MAGVNYATLSGRVSRPPRRVRIGGDGEDAPWGYAFPLAVRQRRGIVFPMVVVQGELPPFVTYHQGKKLHQQPLVTVVAARLRTRNLTHGLAEDLVGQARRAGAGDEVAERLFDVLGDSGLVARHVVTDLLVRPDQILEGGSW
jgi:hypothetical protein